MLGIFPHFLPTTLPSKHNTHIPVDAQSLPQEEKPQSKTLPYKTLENELQKTRKDFEMMPLTEKREQRLTSRGAHQSSPDTFE